MRKPGLSTRAASSLAACLRDNRGTGVVELAVFLPLMALFMVNIIDVSSVVVRRIQMQKAVNTALEMIVANPMKPDSKTGEFDTTDLQEQAASLASVPKEKVLVELWLECDGVEAGTFYDECTDDQVLARYVQIRIADRFVPMFSMSAVAYAHDLVQISAEGALRIQ